MKLLCLTFLSFIGVAYCGQVPQVTAKPLDIAPTITPITRTPTVNLESVKNLRNERTLEGYNFVQGWDNQVSGTGNAVLGKQQNAYGINNYLEGLRNSIKGIGNVGIGEDMTIVGVNNFAYGAKNKIQGTDNWAEGMSNLLKGDKNTAKGVGNLLTGDLHAVEGR